MDISQLQKFIEPFTENILSIFDRINITLIDSWEVTILLGIILCFFGVKIFNASVFWFGALLGSAIGCAIGSSLFDTTGMVVCAVAMGIICGYLLRALVNIGFFLGGLLVGGIIGISILGQHSPWVIPVIILSGILSVIFLKYFVMVSTALWGTILLTGSIGIMIPFSLKQPPYAITAIECVIFLSGITYQVFHLKRPYKSLEKSPR